MARILGIQNKFPELGRIRAGKKTTDAKHPMEALETWRLTSKDEYRIKAVASVYGGEPHAWGDREGEFEVFTEADALDVQLPGDAIFTAFEKWGQGGNTRRCDGETCTVPVQDPAGGHLDTVPCLCDQENLVPGEDRAACSVTVRLKVVLPRIPGIGVWMLTSGSIYAAMELPAVIDLIDALRQRSGILIPCRLELQYREEKRAYEKFTRKYRVPTLHVDSSVQKITASISRAEERRSIAPARPSENPAPPPGTERPSPGAGSGEARPGPTEGSGEPRLRQRGKMVPPHG